MDVDFDFDFDFDFEFDFDFDLDVDLESISHPSRCLVAFDVSTETDSHVCMS